MYFFLYENKQETWDQISMFCGSRQAPCLLAQVAKSVIWEQIQGLTCHS